MEKVCNGQESESAVVYEVIGEPAIVINGVPNVTPGCTSPIHVDAIRDAQADRDPCFGEWLEGRKVQKMFGDQLYSGKVVKYDSETKWYRVVYEDGDLEDLEWHELEEVLVPLDISVPLVTLALQRYKCERAVSESGLHIAKANKSYTRGAVSMEKTRELLQAHHSIETRGGKLIEANADCERIWQVTLKRHKEFQTESGKTTLPMGKCEVSVPKLGDNTARSDQYQNAEDMTKMPELFRRPQTTVIKGERLMQANLNGVAAVQEISETQREIQKRSWKTARAEKQKRREKSWVQGTATELEELS